MNIPTTNPTELTDSDTLPGREIKLIHHKIIISSSYSEKTRIALHYVIKEQEDVDSVYADIQAIRQAYDGKYVSFSDHGLSTKSESWESVVEYDGYFENIRVIDTVDEFIELIRKDRYLKGADVAKYILSKIPCDKSKLHKLTYMCYADYLCETGRRMFTDDIYAFRYGPAVQSVSERYGDGHNGHSKTSNVSIESDGSVLNTDMGINMMAARSRLMFAEDGTDIAYSVDDTLKKYGHLSSAELIEITHRKDTPWDRTPDGLYSRITDECILEYHKNESA